MSINPLRKALGEHSRDPGRERDHRERDRDSRDRDREAPSPKKQHTETGQVTSSAQLSRPFLTRNQIKAAQLRTVTNPTVFEQKRNQMFNFLMKICNSLKLPTRTLETAMNYYQRYFLYNKFDTAVFYDVGLTALFTACKNEDTIKKSRDLITIANQIRNLTLTPEQAESYRKKILVLESKLLETISFDFRNFHIEEFLIKISKDLHISKEVTYLSWLISIDSFQTEIALRFTQHSIAIACLIIGSKLKDEQQIFNDDEKFKPERYATTFQSINEIMIEILDLFISSFNLTFFSTNSELCEYQNKFLDIRIPLSNEIITQDVKDDDYLNDDDFYKERDFGIIERRYMLGNQKKRVYKEL